MYSFLIQQESDLIQVVNYLIPMLKKNTIILMNGDLGSGKTTLVKFFCQSMGVKEIEKVRSPTFSLCHIYEASIPIFHYDLYRLKSKQELDELNIYESIEEEEGIAFVEWACLFENFWNKGFIEIKIEVLKNQERRIKVYGRKEK